jgi:hypothetical protein
MCETFTLVNKSVINAVLYLDLRDHPELKVFLPEGMNQKLLEYHNAEEGSPFFAGEDEDENGPMTHPLEEDAEESVT